MNQNPDIAQIRKTLKLSRAALAEKAGVDVSTICRWEKYGVPDRGPAKALIVRLTSDADKAEKAA